MLTLFCAVAPPVPVRVDGLPCCCQPGFVDFPEVMRATTAWFGHLHDTGVLARRVDVVMVVGADMMKSTLLGSVLGVATSNQTLVVHAHLLNGWYHQ